MMILAALPTLRRFVSPAIVEACGLARTTSGHPPAEQAVSELMVGLDSHGQ
ncbi:MAG TPA: hypothetical protein VGZ22_29740 [Isosphaeraceae bacterium]|jgi:hypothetical protein|nr:hypothetical protein [Isosphaeraceae bacterium]